MATGESHAPNFFVVGAPKAGTTSLYRYLSQHPEIFMSPIKEPAFFAPEIVDFTPESREVFERDAGALRAYLDGSMDEQRANGIVLDWSDYLRLFRNAGSARARGEVSGNYLASPGAAAGIRRRIPHARIVMVLRNPVERLFSQYASAVSAGATTVSFNAWITEQESAEAVRSPRFGPLWTGMYAQHVKRYRDAFPAEQIRIYRYEEYCERPAEVLTDLFRFLQVDPTYPVDTGEKHNVTVVPRRRWIGSAVRAIRPLLNALPPALRSRARHWYRARSRLQVSDADRERVVAIYRTDIGELERELGLDLSAWLETSSTAPPRT